MKYNPEKMCFFLFYMFEPKKFKIEVKLCYVKQKYRFNLEEAL